MFKDLHYECSNLKEQTVEDRALELSIAVPGSHIVAIGGFPVLKGGNTFIWSGAEITAGTLKDDIQMGLGLSGLMTHMNKSNLYIRDLGGKCAEWGHTWAYHWMTLSILMCGYGKDTELAFCRDSNFFLSWPVGTDIGDCFVVNGSLKKLIKFSSKHTSEDFPPEVRAGMKDVADILAKVLP
jgi:hypothetical protein